ncbi:hypothetical protein PMI01_04933 [Caulobacter sp. AP07]|uniref:hypothetical protein n=1 Tax=Caulobacter sp. AP07 TaxID=1144304 RepID=UPI000271F830|nr:hypothetical protein [Caulobacter sp. AP07]EJL22694.1 hypothetical protein PMI01_04933 [Caulobacter sp. AP07]
MKLDKTTWAMLVGAIVVWGAFFALGGGKGAGEWLEGLGRIGAAKKLIAHDLKDPSSALFREVHKTDQAVCGEVNGKNAYGAYAGFRHFIVESGNIAMEPDLPSERLEPGVSMATIDAWNAHTAFSTNWMSKCQGTLPATPASLEPNFPEIKP